MKACLGIIYPLILLTATVSAQRVDDGSVDEAIVRAIESIPENSLTFPPQPETGDPPEPVAKAGEKFVAAWQLYQRITNTRSADPEAKPPQRKTELVNANDEWEKFEDLLERTVGAEQPPEVSEYAKFTYTSLSWCGNGRMDFMTRHQQGLILAYLRNGQPFEALLRISDTRQLGLLLPAFGADPEKFLLGEWLSKQSLPDRVCDAGGETAAGMVMDWIDLHFDSELKMRKDAEQGGAYQSPADLPYFPSTEIAGFLRPGNGVSDKTKARIVEYMETRGTKITPAGTWLYSCPEGAEKWFVPIALRGLDDPLNRIRKRSAKLLETAGVDHKPLVLRPDPKFRVLVNGAPWPGILGDSQRPSLSVKSEKSSLAAGIESMDGAVVTCDADYFRDSGKVLEAALYVYPFRSAAIELPVKYEEMNVVRFTVGELRIAPVFPDREIAPADMTYAVELDAFEEGHVPNRSYNPAIVKNQQPHILNQVSPGEYWLRIRHPGAVLEPRKRITITKDFLPLKPILRKGSSLVVPINWPERADIASLPIELAQMLVSTGEGQPLNLPSMVQIKGANLPEHEDYLASPEAAIDRFPGSVIFPYLPPGKYTIECPDRTIEPSGTRPGCVIKQSSIEVEIKQDSPVFVVTEPLTIRYSRKD